VEVKNDKPLPPFDLLPVDKLPTLQDLGFAIVHVGGTQYKLMKGDVIMTEKLLGAPVGSEILLQKVLLVGTKTWTAVGTPLLERARVHAVVEEQTKTKKTIVFKKKRRKGYIRHNTHRQPFTTLRIKEILFELGDGLDTSKGLDKNLILQNVISVPVPQVQRVPPPPPMLSATNLPHPPPFPSTANPLPNWDKKMIELAKHKKIPNGDHTQKIAQNKQPQQKVENKKAPTSDSQKIAQNKQPQQNVDNKKIPNGGDPQKSKKPQQNNQKAPNSGTQKDASQHKDQE